MILRAFAAHPKYRKSKAAKTAAQLLASRFFQPDVYTSYQAASYWVRFEYPFWWNQLVAALDSVSLIGLSPDDEPIAQALNWLIEHQQAEWPVARVVRSAARERKGNRQSARHEIVDQPRHLPRIPALL